MGMFSSFNSCLAYERRTARSEGVPVLGNTHHYARGSFTLSPGRAYPFE